MTSVETFSATGLLTVAVAGDGQHLFQHLPDPRVRLVPLGTGDPAINVVLLAEVDRKFERLRTASLPPPLMDGIREGRVSLILDASTEAADHSPDRTVRLHNAIQAVGATPRQCIYLTQDRSYGPGYTAHCDATGIAERVSVFAHDYWTWSTMGELAATGPQRFEQGLAAFEARRPVRSRRFVSLNRTPRPPKIVFLLCLLRHQLWEQGYISFGGFRQPGRDTGKPRPTAEQLAEKLPGFGDLIAEVSPYLEDLDARGTVLLRETGISTERMLSSEAVQATHLPQYDDSWFTVATETEMRPTDTRITEKVLKPIFSFHPFFVLGSRGSLRMVRELGFETFGDMFDESYDEEPDVRRRFDAVLTQVVRWCEAPESELRRMEGEVRERLVANARHGYIELPGPGRVRYARAFVDQLLEAMNGGRGSR
jgi:hypothetical protein